MRLWQVLQSVLQRQVCSEVQLVLITFLPSNYSVKPVKRKAFLLTVVVLVPTKHFYIPCMGQNKW